MIEKHGRTFASMAELRRFESFQKKPTKLALVQRAFGCVSIKLANTVDELLRIEFQFNPNVATPRIHQIDADLTLDVTGKAVADEIARQHARHEYKVMRLP